MIITKYFQQMDELTLSLTGSSNGYKIQLRELFIEGASNYTVDDIKLGSSFEAKIRMPSLILDAHYSRYDCNMIYLYLNRVKFFIMFYTGYSINLETVQYTKIIESIATLARGVKGATCSAETLRKCFKN